MPLSGKMHSAWPVCSWQRGCDPEASASGLKGRSENCQKEKGEVMKNYGKGKKKKGGKKMGANMKLGKFCS